MLCLVVWRVYNDSFITGFKNKLTSHISPSVLQSIWEVFDLSSISEIEYSYGFIVGINELNDTICDMQLEEDKSDIQT